MDHQASDFFCDQMGERIAWEVHQVTLNRVPGYGFGIAVSGGRDNPHFSNGDPSIAVSDVIKSGPAEGRLHVNDRIMSANGISLEGVEYATAVQVLRDSGSTVQLVVRRRIVLPSTPEPQNIKIQITKTRKKDDFGLVLGNKIFVKEVGVKLEGNTLQEGDILLKINNYYTDGMNLKEAKKLIENTKEKLNLVVRREGKSCYPAESTVINSKESIYSEKANYMSQNVYVQPPTRAQVEDKSNLVPRGRSRGPIVDFSNLESSPVNRRNNVNDHSAHSQPQSPKQAEAFNGTRHYDDDPLLQRSKHPMPEARMISFLKEGSVGIRLTGGNQVGIFVTAVQPGSPASLQGLQPADKILKVNDMDLKGVTREEAVLLLLGLQDQIQLVVQHRRDEYEHVVASQRGDSFHIKAHFNYEQPNKGETGFQNGDIFHVVDTLHNGVVGAWQVFKIGPNNQETQKGIIPNKSRAEEMATAQFNASKKELNDSQNRGSFFRRRRNSHRRSKSLSKDHWDDVVFGDCISKFPAYERIVFRHPGFMRPVVLFGPLADVAREKLLKDFPEKFSSPQLENNAEDVSKSTKSNGIIRLSAIKEIVDRGKHALLDITPNAVDRLNYAQFYPLVLFLKADSKQVVKELRAGVSKTGHKSSKKLFEQSLKVEKAWNHVFSATIHLSSSESWYRKLRELIDKHQSSPIWMSESKPEENLADDFLFPMGSLRLSYASSPESDLEVTPGSMAERNSPRLVKCSSDPSIATQPDNYPAIPQSSYLPTLHTHSSSQPSYEANGKHRKSSTDVFGGAPPPDLPPRVDRGVKPLRSPNGPGRPSAQERLFGAEPPNYINAALSGADQSSLDRKNNKTNSYDSMSSYDSYNQQLSLGQSTDDFVTGSNGGPLHSQKRMLSHDPYRFTRSTQQPFKAGDAASRTQSLNKSTDYSLLRSQGVPDYSPNKAVSQTKTSATNYKPIPPPKPKNFRPPQHNYFSGPNVYQHSKSYSLAENSSHSHNGVSGSSSMYLGDTSDINGSSLDKGYYGRAGSQYYYNVVGSSRQIPPRDGLDLVHRADQRGSAFELYKKPNELSSNHFLEQSLR